VAGPAAPLPCALNPHLRLLAQSGGAMVRDHLPASDQAKQLLQRERADHQDRAAAIGVACMAAMR
jgi:hypothetical protein